RAHLIHPREECRRICIHSAAEVYGTSDDKNETDDHQRQFRVLPFSAEVRYAVRDVDHAESVFLETSTHRAESACAANARCDSDEENRWRRACGSIGV